jgi:hypothetical protein
MTAEQLFRGSLRVTRLFPMMDRKQHIGFREASSAFDETVLFEVRVMIVRRMAELTFEMKCLRRKG